MTLTPNLLSLHRNIFLDNPCKLKRSRSPDCKQMPEDRSLSHFSHSYRQKSDRHPHYNLTKIQ
ncbi:MAG: hypothetical protein AAGA60_26560 [Cyanobacteria bacterium P01_E01_bin.42]